MDETFAIYESLECENGIPEDIWLSIARALPRNDPAHNNFICFNGRYFVPLEERKRLKHSLPFLLKDKAPMTSRLLLLDSKSSFDDADIPQKCGCCLGPWNESTGHVFKINNVIRGFGCGICVGIFFARQLRCDGWIPKKKNKHLSKKERKRLKRLEKEAREKTYVSSNDTIIKIKQDIYDKTIGAGLETIQTWPDGGVIKQYEY